MVGGWMPKSSSRLAISSVLTPRALFEVVRQHAFVHRGFERGARIMRLEPLAHVVGIEDRKAAHLRETVAADREDIRVTPARASRNCRRKRSAGRSSPAAGNRNPLCLRRTTRGAGRNGSRCALYRDRTRAGSAAAVRRRKGLVQVDVDDIRAHIARLGDTQQRVHVSAVEIEQRVRAHAGSRRFPRFQARKSPSCSDSSPSGRRHRRRARRRISLASR